MNFRNEKKLMRRLDFKTFQTKRFRKVDYISIWFSIIFRRIHIEVNFFIY